MQAHLWMQLTRVIFFFKGMNGIILLPTNFSSSVVYFYYLLFCISQCIDHTIWSYTSNCTAYRVYTSLYSVPTLVSHTTVHLLDTPLRNGFSLWFPKYHSSLWFYMSQCAGYPLVLHKVVNSTKHLLWFYPYHSSLWLDVSQCFEYAL